MRFVDLPPGAWQSADCRLLRRRCQAVGARRAELGWRAALCLLAVLLFCLPRAFIYTYPCPRPLPPRPAARKFPPGTEDAVYALADSLSYGGNPPVGNEAARLRAGALAGQPAPRKQARKQNRKQN